MLQNNHKTLSIAAVQIDVIAGDYNQNIETMINMIEKAVEDGAEIVLFPELVDRGYYMDQYKEIRNCDYSMMYEKLHHISRKYSICIIWGSSYKSGTKVMNTQFMTTKNHPPAPVYYKQNLFPGEESSFFPGTKATSVETGDIAFGFQICYDIRFPECLRAYLPVMPEIIFVSAAWPLARIDHWKLLLIARAIENQCYIVASNRIGCDNNIEFGGTSLIISPHGKVMTCAGVSKAQVVIHRLDLSELSLYRSSFPVLPCD